MWIDRPHDDPLTVMGRDLIVVTEVTTAAAGARCTAVMVDGNGCLSAPVDDVVAWRTFVGTVEHAFSPEDLRDPRGAAADRLRAGALALAREGFARR
ncbi:MAG: hypothetical protein U0324_00045 [Polyangiales bacterium]